MHTDTRIHNTTIEHNRAERTHELAKVAPNVPIITCRVNDDGDTNNKTISPFFFKSVQSLILFSIWFSPYSSRRMNDSLEKNPLWCQPTIWRLHYFLLWFLREINENVWIIAPYRFRQFPSFSPSFYFLSCVCDGRWYNVCDSLLLRLPIVKWYFHINCCRFIEFDLEFSCVSRFLVVIAVSPSKLFHINFVQFTHDENLDIFWHISLQSDKHFIVVRLH